MVKPASITNAVFTSQIDHEPIFDQASMRYLVYQRERSPTTGKLHWQGYVEFKRNLRTQTGQNQLGDPDCHIERRTKTSLQASEYCKKEETRVSMYVEHGERNTANDCSDDKRSRGEIYARALAEPTYEGAMAIIAAEQPEAFCRSYCSINAALSTKKRPVQFVQELQYGFKLPDAITNWLEKEFTKKERCRCLVLVGPTKLGKTAWARSLGHHMFWRLDVNFGEWDETAKYIVIDEIEWKYIPKKKGLLTHMGDITINAKYKKTRNVCNNKPAIVIVNELDINEEQAYWRENTTIVYVTDKLFDTTQRMYNVADDDF